MKLKKIKTKKQKHISKKKDVIFSLMKKKYMFGGDTDTSPITKYYYYSSHNTALITMQINGSCSSCVIQDFINNEYSIGGCMEFDLRFVNFKAKTISIDHFCIGKGLDFETTLKQIISLYGDKKYTGVKYPLIISIDANMMSKPANKPDFASLWNEILTKCFAEKYSDLRPDFKITVATQLKEIMGKILFRWAYNDTNNVSKNLYKSDATTNNISRINITKDMSVTEHIEKGQKKNIKKSIINDNIVRLYPKTPIIKGAFNYNFTYYMLRGIQMCALNLGHNDKYTHAYNAFFKYDKVIHIPKSISAPEQLQLLNESNHTLEIEPQETKILECFTEANLNTQINDILQKHVGDITPELDKQIIDLVTFYETCNKEKEKNNYGMANRHIVSNEYLKKAKTFKTADGTYTLSNIHNVIHISKTIPESKITSSFVGGGNTDIYNIYSITLTNKAVTLLTAYNIFYYNNLNIYKHFINDMHIFNILYLKVKFNKNTYIGCINLSKKYDINLESDDIPIDLFLKTNDYIKTREKRSNKRQLTKTMHAVLPHKSKIPISPIESPIPNVTPTINVNSRPETPPSTMNANSRPETPPSTMNANSRPETPPSTMNANSRPETPPSTMNANSRPESKNNSISLEKCSIYPEIITINIKLKKTELTSEV